MIISGATLLEGKTKILYEVSIYGQQHALFDNLRDAEIAAEKLREAEELEGNDRECVVVEERELLLG